MNLRTTHRRRNPLNGQWVLVSPHRANRPWLGQVEKPSLPKLPDYDPNCYLCPGNTRTSGKTNDDYQSTFVFDNDFPALLPSGDEPKNSLKKSELFQAEDESGNCRVVCFSPKHNLSLPEMSVANITRIVNTWAEQIRELSNETNIQYVQVFENKGEVMGCSQPHPHSQIWATKHIPNEPFLETVEQSKYFKKHRNCLLCDYLDQERNNKIRIVIENEHFTALVPFWAVWPFEILLIANDHIASMPMLSPSQRIGLADIMKKITIKYDNLFESSFPYSMGFHGEPGDGEEHQEWHFHGHYYPPLLRSATVKKFMVGFEMLAMPQRDITAETAAEMLRNLSDTHYKQW